MALTRHFAAAILAAGLLIWIRGGFSDAPVVVIVFGAVGFGASALISAQKWIDAALGRSELAVLARNLVAIACLMATLLGSGRLIISAGFGWWVIFVSLAFLVPFTTSIAATEWPIFVGVVSATCLAASLFFEHAATSGDGAPVMAWQGVAALWLVAAVLSTVSSIPLHLVRRATHKME
ncbi:MAG: hypothetical protein ACRD5F_11110 [Candidatus Acidiferrales bacterium]